MVKHHALASVAGTCAALLLAVGLASCSSILGYAAVVNGSTISQSSINQQLADISANPDYVKLIDQPGGSGPVAGGSTGSYNKAFVATLLDQQVRYEIIRQQLVAAKSVPSADKVAAAKAEVTRAFPAGVYAKFPVRYQNRLASQQANADAFVTTVASKAPDNAVNQFYQAHLGDYATEACVRHILIADKDASGQLDYTTSLADAQKVKGLLDGGGDFAALAKQYSQDNQGTTGGSAAAGGMLQGSATDGCLTTADLQQLIAEFAQAVLSAPINQVSAPVKTQFGYHLIEVTKRATEPLDSTVTADIQRRLAGQQLSQLVVAAHVKVNPEFGSFSHKANSTGQIAGVTPPIVPNLTATNSTGATASGTSGATAGG